MLDDKRLELPDSPEPRSGGLTLATPAMAKEGKVVMWSRETALNQFLNSLSKKAAAQLPKNKEERAARMGVISSDHPLVTRILERSPLSLRDWIREVLVVLDESATDTIAESVAEGKLSRKVLLHRGLFTVQDMFSYAHQEFLKAWSPWLSAQLAETERTAYALEDALSAIEELVALFLQGAPGVPDTFQPVLSAMRALDEDLSALPSILADVDRSRNGQHAQLGAVAGTLFVFAHELSHHLLGHTRISDFPNGAPATEYLMGQYQRLGQVGFVPPETMATSHKQEFDADALAFLLILGPEADDEKGQTQRLLDAAQGAFVALPALALSRAAEAEGGDWREAGSHPSFPDRVRAIGRLADVCSTFVPDTLHTTSTAGERVEVRPTDYLQQLWACQEYLWILMQER